VNTRFTFSFLLFGCLRARWLANDVGHQLLLTGLRRTVSVQMD
jgi:hypothetical protein